MDLFRDCSITSVWQAYLHFDLNELFKSFLKDGLQRPSDRKIFKWLRFTVWSYLSILLDQKS